VLDRDGTPRLLDFRFNAWGGKYGWDLDDRITPTLHADGAFGRIVLATSPLTLEGGAIDTDGNGTLLATTRTLVDPERNPAWRRRACEAELTRCLGIRRFLWLEHGYLSGDDTDGHIDTLARFCAPDTICYVQSQDAGDRDHAELVAMEKELHGLRQADGRPYRLVPLPCPAPLLDPEDGHRLPASYANFLILNGAVLMPSYADPADQTAAAVLGKLFPGREILAIDCRPLVRQGGSLHCITMQLPAGVILGR
jgi:agmatine/peptidylarginine deiminase